MKTFFIALNVTGLILATVGVFIPVVSLRLVVVLIGTCLAAVHLQY